MKKREREYLDALPNEKNIFIPQWQMELVLAEDSRIEDDPSLLVDWETVKAESKIKDKY